jgi:hypothetical protein
MAADRTAPADDLEALEREHAEQLARAHAALAEAQDRSYWLDRWGIDLNALMRRRGARRLRALLRWLRELRRGAIAIRRYADARASDLRKTAAEDELATASGRRGETETGASVAEDPAAPRA